MNDGEAVDRALQVLADVGRVYAATYPRVTRPGGQCGEDAILEALLPEARGHYVDVGAGEPVECSNTIALYRRGWSGLLVEPLQEHWISLLRQRPRDHLIPVAALERPGYAELRVSGTVSSLRPDWPIEPQRTARVEVDTLANVLQDFPEIRSDCGLLSIDVEGCELEVLQGIDWATFRPRVIVVEYRRYDPEQLGLDVSASFEPFILQHGYELRDQTDLNKVYGRRR